MKYIVNTIVLCLLSFISCNIDKGSTEKQSDMDSIGIAGNIDLAINDSVCLSTAISFTPTSISLSESIQKDSVLDEAIDGLRENKLFLSETGKARFIYIILLKMYYYHLVNAHQGFDLLQMCDTENSKYIVNQFKQASNLPDRLEMLNSGYISEFLKSNQIDYIQDEESKLLSEIEDYENRLDDYL